jgi:hypothetical protein
MHAVLRLIVVGAFLAAPGMALDVPSNHPDGVTTLARRTIAPEGVGGRR